MSRLNCPLCCDTQKELSVSAACPPPPSNAPWLIASLPRRGSGCGITRVGLGLMASRLKPSRGTCTFSHPQRLRKVARVCESHGTRVQLSVFELQLKPGELEALQQKLRRIIDPRVDKIRYYRICAADHADIKLEGVGELSQPHRYTVV